MHLYALGIEGLNGSMCCTSWGLRSWCGVGAQFVRRWSLESLEPALNHELYGHNYPVRSLAAGNCETLVSADAGGEVAVWRI